MIVDLGKDKGGQLALGECFILIKSLTVTDESACHSGWRIGQWQAKIADNAHLAQGTSDFCPNSVDIIVESLQGKDLELGFVVGQEAQHSGCRDEAGHNDSGGTRMILLSEEDRDRTVCCPRIAMEMGQVQIYGGGDD